MTFDHNLGIPYIPASSIKGIVRFAHTLDLIENNFDKVSMKQRKMEKMNLMTRKIGQIFLQCLVKVEIMATEAMLSF